MTASCPKQYIFSPQVTPSVGSSPPSITPPVFTHRENIVLTYPYISPTLTIRLRTPSFGDTNVVTVESVRNVTVSNVPRFYRDPTWPVAEILTYNIEATYDVRTVDLTSYPLASLVEFQTFIRDSIGSEIGLLDFNNVQWHGFILNPDAPFLRNQLNNSAINLIFRGIRA